MVCGNLRNVFFEQIFVFLLSLGIGSPDEILAKKIWRKKGGMGHPNLTWLYYYYHVCHEQCEDHPHGLHHDCCWQFRKIIASVSFRLFPLWHTNTPGTRDWSRLRDWTLAIKSRKLTFFVNALYCHFIYTDAINTHKHVLIW